MTSICLCHKHLPSWGTETRANKLFQYCKQAVCIPRASSEENFLLVFLGLALRKIVFRVLNGSYKVAIGPQMAS